MHFFPFWLHMKEHKKCYILAPASSLDTEIWFIELKVPCELRIEFQLPWNVFFSSACTEAEFHVCCKQYIFQQQQQPRFKPDMCASAQDCKRRD
jgi:hypothetical protein